MGCVAAFVAGAVNSLAGGGTLLTFPALLASGMGSTVANATSTTALFPAQLSALAGLREHLSGSGRLAWELIGIGIAGGLVGAWLLTVTPASWFDVLVPFLILGATILFLLQEPLARRRAESGGSDSGAQAGWSLPKALGLVAVAVYGGYFGAGIGILTLAALGALGVRDIHRMNALKAAFTLGANGIAVAVFVGRGLTDLPTAFPMAIFAAAGGFAGARLGKRIGRGMVRRLVIAIGFGLAAVQLGKLLT